MTHYLGSTYRVTRSVRRLVNPYGLGDTRDGKKASYTEYAFSDGYTYRQFTDGDILIAKSPRSKIPVLLSEEGGSAQETRAWKAITRRIKAHGDKAKVKHGKMDPALRNDIIRASGNALAHIIASTAPAGHASKAKDDAPDTTADDGPQPSRFPFVPIAIGGAVLVVIAAFVSASSPKPAGAR